MYCVLAGIASPVKWLSAAGPLDTILKISLSPVLCKNGVLFPEREAHHSPPSSAEVCNACPHPPTHWHCGAYSQR